MALLHGKVFSDTYHMNSPEAQEGKLFISLRDGTSAKFPDEILRILDFMPVAPASLDKLDELDEDYLIMENDYNSFKE